MEGLDKQVLSNIGSAIGEMNEEFKSRIENDEYQIKFVDEKTIDDIKAYKKNIVMTKGVNLLKSYRAKHPTLNKKEFVIFDILML